MQDKIMKANKEINSKINIFFFITITTIKVKEYKKKNFNLKKNQAKNGQKNESQNRQVCLFCPQIMTGFDMQQLSFF